MAAGRAEEVTVEPAGTNAPGPAAPPPAAAPGSTAGGRPDAVAIATIVLVAAMALASAWVLPWWVMKARAPQYGQRVLVIQIGPRTVEGDVREMDTLGHYVGIRPMGALARVERTLAPLGMLGALAGIALVPWVRRRWMRLLFVLPALLMPVILLVDLQLWMDAAVNQRDPEAPLNLTVSRIDPKLFGEYAVGQFKVATELGGGFYLSAMAGLLGLGLAFTRPLRGARRVAGAAAAGVALLAATDVQAAELAVGAAFRSVGDAVAAARDGDTVVVPRGIYREHVVVERRVRLVGQPGAVIDGGGTGTVLTVRGAGTEVRNLTLRGSGTSYVAEDAGLRIEQAPDVRMVDVRIEDTLFGVFVAHGDRCVIEGSTIVGKDLPHVRRGDGIRLWYSAGCRLSGNRVERSRDVIIWYSSGTVVEDNVVHAGRYGLHYMYSNDNVFHRNRFEDNQVGAAIMYSRGIRLTENAFSFSNGPAAYGLLLKDADDVFIVGNRFVHNDTGLFFDGAPQSREGRVDVRGNLIARGHVGIALQPLSRGIRFWENALVGNRVGVQVQGTGTAEGNTWAVSGRGNYWTDAVVYDADGDGVSELPYRVDSTWEVLADRYPVLAFFADTPPAEAIDLGARLFPLFAPRPKLTDPAPLVRPALGAWAREDERAAPDRGLAAVGLGMIGLAALAGVGAREVLG